jgi:hypothetical protein
MASVKDVGETQPMAVWYAYGDKLISLGHALFQNADVLVTEKGFAEPKILTLALLCRTISNFRGVIALAKAGLVVEARSLTRSCFENLFFIGGLIEKGDEFVSLMFEDELKSMVSRGTFALELQQRSRDASESKPPIEHKLGERLTEMRRRWPKAKFLNPKEAAKSSVIEHAYLFYSQLSADAAHPSLFALKRYLVRHVEGGEQVLGIDVCPANAGDEIAQTVDIACNAVLGSCVGVNQMLGGTALSARIKDAFDEYEELARVTPRFVTRAK